MFFYVNPILIAAAVLPAILLLRYVYRADRLEKEPPGLLLSLVLFGILATFAAIVTEELGETVLAMFLPEYSVAYKINPATALKGINLLVDAGLLYKKRGVGMFVSSGARERLRAQRAERFYQDYVQRMVQEARRLGVTEAELVRLVERGFGGCDD